MLSRKRSGFPDGVYPQREIAAASFMHAQARVARALLELAQLLGEDAGESGRATLRPWLASPART